MEENKPAYLCFVDLKNAFDRGTRTGILIILEEQDVQPKYRSQKNAFDRGTGILKILEDTYNLYERIDKRY